MFSSLYCSFVLLLSLLQCRVTISSSSSACDISTVCQFDSTTNHLICDGTFIPEDSASPPSLSCYPSGTRYTFRHFRRLSPTLLETLQFPSQERSIHFQLFNISLIASETFSNRLSIRSNVTLSIDIEHWNSSSGITLEPNAFNHLQISHLRFFNINHFNSRRIFDTSTFGDELDLNQLIFDQCGITGFVKTDPTSADVQHLSILHSSALTQLTPNNLPSFLPHLKSFTISNTSLRLINPHSFPAWTMQLEKFILTKNDKLETIPSNMMDGVLIDLDQLDLSENPLLYPSEDFDWFGFSYATRLVLRASPLDPYLRTNILSSLSSLKMIDFSYGYLSDRNQSDLISTHFPDQMSELVSFNLSHANISESVLIGILEKLSGKANQRVQIDLAGHRLSDEKFCSYLKIVKKAPTLLDLHLDSSHPCNCILDLFEITDCPKCDLQNQTSFYRCQLSSEKNDDGIGPYAFTGLIVGVSVFLFILMLVGGGFLYRRRRKGDADLDMEHPIENPLAVVIQKRMQRH